MPTPQNGQTHSNILRAVANAELFEFVWPFCGVGDQRVDHTFFSIKWAYPCFYYLTIKVSITGIAAKFQKNKRENKITSKE